MIILKYTEEKPEWTGSSCIVLIMLLKTDMHCVNGLVRVIFIGTMFYSSSVTKFMKIVRGRNLPPCNAHLDNR